MRWVIRPVVILVAALLALAPAGAQAEKRVALVIGNSAYRNTPPLPNPRNDAVAIADALQKLGFAVQSGFDLDRAATEQALRTSRSMPSSPTRTTCRSRPSIFRWCCR
jgi:Caspase domain